MPPLFGIWNPTEPKLLRRVHDRLASTGGCRTVRYEPSRRVRNEVVAEVDPAAFLERASEVDDARLRVEFDLRGDEPHYWIQWWAPDPGRGLGWHRDETEPAYGPLHLQIDRADGTVERRAGEYREDEHPYRSFERHLARLPELVPGVRA